MFSPSVRIQTDYTKHRGVRHTNSGKWGAAIRHPITKVSVWLGSYCTPKEAADAYIKKKLEFDSLVADAFIKKKREFDSMVADAYIKKKLEFYCNATAQKAEEARSRKSCEAKVMDQAEIKCEESHVHIAENVKAPSVGTRSVDNSDVANPLRRSPGSGSAYQNNAGRWGAYMSVGKEKVCVGTFTTREEAEAALCKKRLDIDSMSPVVAAVAKELDPECGFKRTRNLKKPSCESMNDQITCSKPRGVYQRKSGKWYSEIINPMTKVKHKVGSYETAQEALEALNRKRREYAEMKHKQSNVETELVSETGISDVKVAHMDGECGGSQMKVDNIEVPCSSVVSNENFDLGIINAFGELVGEFCWQDLNYMSPVEVAVTKELDPVCGSKRTRKHEMALSETSNGQITCSRPHGVYQRKSGKWFAEIINPITKVKRSVGSYETAQEALDALNRKRREYAEMKKHKQSNVETELVSECQDIVYEAGISDVKVADIDVEGGGSRVSAGSVQLPLSSFVSNQDDEFDMSSVINCYGELVGEFSRLDDELWLDV